MFIRPFQPQTSDVCVADMKVVDSLSKLLIIIEHNVIDIRCGLLILIQDTCCMSVGVE